MGAKNHIGKPIHQLTYKLSPNNQVAFYIEETLIHKGGYWQEPEIVKLGLQPKMLHKIVFFIDQSVRILTVFEEIYYCHMMEMSPILSPTYIK